MAKITKLFKDAVAPHEQLALNKQLLDACWYNRAEEIPSLLKSGADPYAVNLGGASAISTAARYPALKTLKALFDAGVDLYKTDGNNHSVKDFPAAAAYVDKLAEEKRVADREQALRDENTALRQEVARLTQQLKNSSEEPKQKQASFQRSGARHRKHPSFKTGTHG